MLVGVEYFNGVHVKTVTNGEDGSTLYLILNFSFQNYYLHFRLELDLFIIADILVTLFCRFHLVVLIWRDNLS